MVHSDHLRTGRVPRWLTSFEDGFENDARTSHHYSLRSISIVTQSPDWPSQRWGSNVEETQILQNFIIVPVLVYYRLVSFFSSYVLITVFYYKLIDYILIDKDRLCIVLLE